VRIAVRDLAAHGSRFLLTTLAVTVGVAFVVGSFTLTDSPRTAFGGSIDELNSGTDLVVRRHA
jgi:putative ABC transport system permease protein